MQGRTSNAKGKGKVGEASKRPRRSVPKFSWGTISVPGDFMKVPSSKRDCGGKEAPRESIEGVGPMKLSNDDRMRLTAMIKGAKAVKYKLRAKKARGIIHRQKDRAMDRWLKSEEFIDAVEVEYMMGSTETKFLISKVDPKFNFERLEDVRAEELVRTASNQLVRTPLNRNIIRTIEE
ncbi:hypothetical protein ACOSQ4_023595 [Xanthoceras sorbifolium]